MADLKRLTSRHRVYTMMKSNKTTRKFVFFLALAFIFLACTSSNESKRPVKLQGKIIDVVKKRDSDDIHDIYLKIEKTNLKEPESEQYYFVDDFFIIFLLESTHSLIFADYTSSDISSKNLYVKFEGIVVEQRNIDGVHQNVITEVNVFFPDYPASETSYEYRKINPGCPEPSYHHRYITVPISYDHLEWGELELYYELCSDYDEKKPTVIVPTDGQRTFSQVGWADRYKQIFDISLNVVTYEYRGMYCSCIPSLQKEKRDWYKIYESLNSDNVVEDIERIRLDLLGDKKIGILGGSGTAMIGLKYLSKYHKNVDRAFLMSFFKDAKGSSESGIQYFEEFLKKNDLEHNYADIVSNRMVKIEQILFLIQRLLYFDRNKAVELIEEVSRNELTLFEQLTDQLGTVDYFVRSAKKYKPWTVVFMFETNIITSAGGTPDINYPFLKEAEPLIELVDQGIIPREKFDIPNLKDIATEVLLVGGTLDQVAPIKETLRVHNELPNSRFIIFEAYHCLEQPPESKQARNDLVDLFFLFGGRSEELNSYLKIEGEKAHFLDFIGE